MVVALAVIAILASLVGVSLRRAGANQELNDAGRNIMGLLMRVRTAATSKQASSPATSAIARLDNSVDAYLQTGIRIESPTTISMFGDPDANPGNGNRTVFSVLDLAAEYPEANLQIVNPPPNDEIRFRRDATLVSGPNLANQITLRNQQSGIQVQVVVTLAGIPRIQ